MVAVLDVVAVSQIGKMYRFLALPDDTVVAEVEAMGTAVIPAALVPVCKFSVPATCMLEVEKQIRLKFIWKKLLLAEVTDSAGLKLPKSLSLPAVELSVP